MSLLLALQSGGAETITVDKWYAALSQPARRPTLVFAPAGGYVPPLGATAVTVDTWFAGFVDPVRAPRPAAASHFGFDPTPIVPFGWAMPLSVAIRPPALPLRPALVYVAPPASVVEQWFMPLGEPARRLTMPARSEQFFVYAPPTVTLDWLLPLSEPVRQLLPVSAQQVLAYVGVVAPEVISVDKWFAPLSEPARFPPMLPVPLQQALAYVEAEPFAETVTIDRWLQPLSIPAQRVLLGLSPAVQQFTATDTVTPPVPPVPPAVDQFTVSGEQVIDRFTHDGVTYPLAPITRRTN